MSIKLMAAAWETSLPSTEKMVLLCLCDFANDDGKCWPSVATMARKCSKSERTIQKALSSLVGMGILVRLERDGTSTVYTINPRKFCTPAETSPPQVLTVTPAESAPKPSRTTNKQNRKRAIPANWRPDDFGVNTKCSRIIAGWNSDQFETHLEQFIAHHRARDNKFADPQAAWQTWVINTEKFNGGRGGKKTFSSHGSSGDGFIRALDRNLAKHSDGSGLGEASGEVGQARPRLAFRSE